MALVDLATGDTIRIVTVTGGSFGAAPTLTTSGTDIDCRIDVHGGSEDRRAGRADKRRSMTIFFLTEPSLPVGSFIKWTKTGAGTVTLGTPIYMRVGPRTPEGRPGEAPSLWWANAEEVSARDIGGAV